MAKNVWQVAEAKARFSELLDRVAREGPQKITRNGRATALVIQPDGRLPEIGDYAPNVLSRPPEGPGLDDATIDALFLRGNEPSRLPEEPLGLDAIDSAQGTTA